MVKTAFPSAFSTVACRLPEHGFVRAFMLILLVLAATPALAQTSIRHPEGWSLSLGAGGTAYTDFQRGTLRATRQTATGSMEQRDFPRRVGAKTAGAVGGSIAYWPSGNWGFRLNATYAPSRFQTIISPTAAEFSGEPRAASDSLTMASLAIATVQAQAVFRLPTIHQRITPYGFFGAGVMRYSIPGGADPVPEEARGDFASGSNTRFAGSLGAGARLRMRRSGWGLNFEFADQISGTPVKTGPVRVLNAVSFTVGLSVSFREL